MLTPTWRHSSSPRSRCLNENRSIVLGTSEDILVEDAENSFKASHVDSYSRKLIEFCSSKALEKVCFDIGEKLGDGDFSRFIFDMMLAWENPGATEDTDSESIGKEREDKKETIIQGNAGEIYDEIPLFYSDIMPLLVDEEKSVGEDAFVWLSSVLPLVGDVSNAQFTFETLTATIGSRFHYPACDRFLKEMDRYIKYLQKQTTPTGFKLAEDECILHVDGTAATQRVVRHIGATRRLTLTNLALYFEASKSISYENALRIDLRTPDVDHQVRSSSTGPFGAPLFDKAITYESSQLEEPLILEFPEMTSSTRRDHWLALIREVILMHKFVSKFMAESAAGGEETSLGAQETQARMILSIVRLHAAREMLRIAPPNPIKFLIFALFDEMPKGDYVLEELSSSLRTTMVMSPCSATAIVKSLKMLEPVGVPSEEAKGGVGLPPSGQESEALASLETKIEQVREEAKEAAIAKATVERLKNEGIADSLLVLAELLNPLKSMLDWYRKIIAWERPAISFFAFVVTHIIIYKEWVGQAIAALLLTLIGVMLWARWRRAGELPAEIVVSFSSDKTTVESIVAAQCGLKNLDDMVKSVNIAILKLHSIMTWRSPKHGILVIYGLCASAVVLMVVPFRYILMSLVSSCFMFNIKTGSNVRSEQGISRRIREWWETISVIPVRVVGNS
ncbi:hypothetical protein AXF42_Ash020874 [Apostasia shenzhenica]|uniref:Uncharacterized protein n=1 Tax=Apostasia shenzhenica TaxID=1088818 RepID=A0A2H9ZRZ7_9ASPA|nr:hypothetical protein AXF42_Ash020874 [Apostasia shenzhenica]